LQLKKLSLDPDIDPEQVDAGKKLNMLKHKQATAAVEFDLGTIAEKEKLERVKLENTSKEYEVIGKTLDYYRAPGADMSMISVKDGKVSINNSRKNLVTESGINRNIQKEKALQALNSGTMDLQTVLEKFNVSPNDPDILQAVEERNYENIKSEASGKVNTQDQRPFWAKKVTQEDGFDSEKESLIEENMAAYGKSRGEIINALKKKGLL
jgi:hypothetical protein